MLNTPTDIDLLLALMRDDEVAFTLVYKRYQPSLYQVCMKYIMNEDTANDVVQNVFMWLWKNRKDLTMDVNLRSYLCTATRNNILNMLRHENMAIKHNYIYAQQQLSDDSWLEKMRHEGQLQHIRDMLNELPEQRKRICKMKIDDGLTNQQIADALGLSVQTVKNQYSSAIRELKELLSESNQTFLQLG